MRSVAVASLGLLVVACSVRPSSSQPGPALQGRNKPALGPAVVEPNVPPATECGDAPLITLEELAAGQRPGERVSVETVPRAAPICFQQDCLVATAPGEPQPPPEEICCNACGGNYEAYVGTFTLTFTGLEGCSGMDCNLRCAPFGRRPAKRYRFVGRNGFRPASSTQLHPTSVFEVEKVCAAG